jgi:hypothetical protein
MIKVKRHTLYRKMKSVFAYNSALSEMTHSHTTDWQAHARGQSSMATFDKIMPGLL